MAHRRLYFEDLPDETVCHVFSFLPVKDLGRVVRVSKLWRDIGNDDEVWKCVWQREANIAEARAYEGSVHHGEWKKTFLDMFWSRNFDVHRHHSDIEVDVKRRTATVKGQDEHTYKGVMTTPEIPMHGVSTFSFLVKFLDTNNNTDHIALGVANDRFNTKTACPEGWTDNNGGIGWYSSNGAVYMGSQYNRVEDGDSTKNSVITDGNVISLTLDRNAGTLVYTLNGQKQGISAQSDALKTDRLFVCLILMHDIEVTMLPTVGQAGADVEAPAPQPTSGGGCIVM